MKDKGHEAHIPTKPPSPSSHTWISGPDEHEGRPPNLEKSSRQGQEAPRSVLIIKRIRNSQRSCVISPTSERGYLLLQRLRRAERIARRPEFKKIQKFGVRTHGRFMTLLVHPNQQTLDRLGIVASRRVGNATRRNRAKRLVRELFRKNKISHGLDVVVLVRREMPDVDLPSLIVDYKSALYKAAKRCR